ncbi:josephin protein [Cardiosporidium cionae]|uniref:ubiquitinyl hydrolase 1 n=1 Tax=Cardiosporidium cionae TaxID=476202 RepID=A0ABQ7JH64_9APIC|nr:josephin protein [Cardiosporidium cionae]|eukprot:KAF8823120.1 josephin protein [Cardiosporidium cionae]
MASIGEGQTQPHAVIYWEKQGADRLCALHCLNSLLQGPYFSVSDLAMVAAELDAREQLLRAEAGVNTREFQEFVDAGSPNMADDGFFSLAVLERCLKVLQIYCIPSSNPSALSDPSDEAAFICNLSEHWFTLRKLHGVWYNLDSMRQSPTTLSEFYLSTLLSTLANEGYSIFIIRSNLASLPQAVKQELYDSTKFYLPHPLINDKGEGYRKIDGNPLDASNKNASSLIANRFATNNEESQNSLEENEDLQRAMKLSWKSLQEGMARPPEEPSVDTYAVTISVRVSSEFSLKRQFFEYDTLKIIFTWLEFATLEYENLQPPLCVRNSYSLLLQFPTRKYCKTAERGIRLILEEGTLSDASDQDLSDVQIKSLNWERLQRVILHL